MDIPETPEGRAEAIEWLEKDAAYVNRLADEAEARGGYRESFLAPKIREAARHSTTWAEHIRQFGQPLIQP